MFIFTKNTQENGYWSSIGQHTSETKNKQTKEGSKTIHPFLLFKWDVWFGKNKRRRKEKLHIPSHRLALSIICLVLFLWNHLDQSYVFLPGFRRILWAIYCINFCLFSVSIFHFLDIALCLGWHISTLFFSHLLFMISRPLRSLVFPWCFVFFSLVLCPLLSEYVVLILRAAGMYKLEMCK